ncbi:MAG: phospholipase D-like domain-containing protein, partial [Oscillospiraceae bacterium]
YFKHLRKLGIETHVFNMFKPSIDVFMNYRDHRKITVIDGNVGFTGGNNLADEYINAITVHGHFKDTSIKLTGDAVWNLSVMFMQQWQFYAPEKMDYERYRPTLPQGETFESDGYVQPFGDSPFDNHLIGEMTYMNLIEHANDYISITTPYLILDNEMITALRTAALSGVNVKIITPHIGDHWYVHMVTRYNYSALIKAGVEIYEYTPGFIHAKTIVIDDIAAVVGTQNFDYRSFYLHFECGALLYKNSEISKIRKDHLDTIKKSKRISIEDCKTKNPFKRFVQMILNLFAPLL